MTWLLTILGSLLSAVPALRSVAFGASLLTIVSGGAWLVWTLRDQDEAPRIERAARTLLEKENLAAHVEQLEAAVKQSTETLAARETALAESEAELAALKKAQEDKRNASPAPGTIVIPAGDPWLGGVRE